MVCSDTAEVIYNKDTDEFTVISKVKIKDNKNVVAAVSVLFTQTKKEDDIDSRISAFNIPTSLSIISLPQTESQECSKVMGHMVTEHLHPSRDNTDNHMLKDHDIKVESNISGNHGHMTKNHEIVHHSKSCQTDSDCIALNEMNRIRVDASTNTDNINTTTNSSEKKNALERPWVDSNGSIYCEGSEDFIITENKSSEDESSLLTNKQYVESRKRRENMLQVDLGHDHDSSLAERVPKFSEESVKSNSPILMIHDSDSDGVSDITMTTDNKNSSGNVSTLQTFPSNLKLDGSNSLSSNHTSQQRTESKNSYENKKPRFFRSISKGNKMCSYRCQVCHKSVLSLADMFHHSKLHNLGIKCCVCGMKAFDWGVMKHHYSWHLSKITFKCPQCFAIFSSREFLSAHMVKAHSASRKFVMVKNAKLKPPASKLTVSRNSVMPKTTLGLSVNKPVTTTEVSSSMFQLTKFSPFSNSSSVTATVSVGQPEHITVTPLSPERMISCGSCEEKFTNIEMLKNHGLVCGSGKKVPTPSIRVDTPTTFTVDDNATCGSSTHFVTSDNSNTVSSVFETCKQPEIKQEIPDIIDIEQLSKFTESLSRSNLSRSTLMSNISSDLMNPRLDHTHSSDLLTSRPDHTHSSDFTVTRTNQSCSSDCVIQRPNHTHSSDHITPPDQTPSSDYTVSRPDPESIPSSFDISPSSTRQRRTASRLANIMPVCRICGVYLNNWNEILEHRFVHPVELGDQLVCTVCTSVLSTRDSLKRHAINHMGIRHQCLYCENEYSRRDTCVTHMKSAHGHSSKTFSTSQFPPNA